MGLHIATPYIIHHTSHDVLGCFCIFEEIDDVCSNIANRSPGTPADRDACA